MKLSIVVTTRNDDHGVGLTERTNIFMHALSEQVQTTRIDTELIIVEWNPPPDRPRLIDELEYITDSEYMSTRVVTVSPEIHHTLDNSDILPLFQMIAKNVGIRRAQGDWILATNPDIIFSSEIFEFLARGELDHNAFYRASRYDIKYNLLPRAPIDELLGMCQMSVVRAQDPKSPTGIHTNACGDFTMLSREQWHYLRGYPEYELWSMHIDSLFLFIADVAGMHQCLLGWPVYHFKHVGSWSTTPRHDLPMLHYTQVNKMWIDMKAEGEPKITNPATWGLADADLEETVIDSTEPLHTAETV